MNTNIQKIITIDGPAGAGKSTLARELAKKLDWIYLDTGALYRAVAYTALQRGIDPAERQQAEELTRQIEINVAVSSDGTNISVSGENITHLLRSPEISKNASTISAWPGVRSALLSIQKDLGAKGEVVAEGRDMGTVVFPDAGLKFYLYASAGSRANRRFMELMAAGHKVEYEKVLAETIARDQADENRDIAPLKKPHDAITIDSTNLDIEAVLKIMLNSFRNRFFG